MDVVLTHMNINLTTLEVDNRATSDRILAWCAEQNCWVALVERRIGAPPEGVIELTRDDLCVVAAALNDGSTQKEAYARVGVALR